MPTNGRPQEADRNETRYTPRSGRRPRLGRLCLVSLAAGAVTLLAHAELPEWLQHIASASAIESALYRAMAIPNTETLYPRPPKESQTALAQLIANTPNQADLYALRAKADEQALDFTAAEADWKAYVAHAPAAKVELADFYHRRLDTAKETAVLYEIAKAPASAEEKDLPAQQQTSWKTFERLLTLVADQQLPDSNQQDPVYRAFLERYPNEQSVYDRYLQLLLKRKDFTGAQSLIDSYKRAVPKDIVFPLRSTALVELTRGNTTAALAVYDKAFEPLWPSELVSSYFALLTTTHHQRDFLDDARTRLARNPDDLNAAARLFFYYQQESHQDTALEQLAHFRRSKDVRHAAWSANDLYTLAQLTSSIQSYADTARYDYALSSLTGTLPDGTSAAEAGLAGLIHLLLTAPEQPIALGTGNLTLYRDIATLDQGPGYWNGILSLWLNGQSPDTQYRNETQQAQPYFHRAKAAELLANFDQRFPASASRPSLHSELIQAYASYGESPAVITAGKSFLASFPKANERSTVVSAMADAYARQNDIASEFALYESVLDEMPQFLDRYIARLTATKQQPRALTVLRHQLDLKPDDPARYERLATFLEQNDLSSEQEAVYKLAIARFQGTGWDDKLARLYLRERNREAFATLTRQVTDTFSGTDLDAWFGKVEPGQPLGAALALQLNLYAHQRFPHDLVFTRNLLNAYQRKPTFDAHAREALLRASWWQSPEFRNEFFASLSHRGQLDAELAALAPLATEQDPAATRELAEANLWTSHFEQSAPLLGTLVQQYPADEEIGETAVSIFRSLAYLDPASTARAVAVQQQLIQSQPDTEGWLETLGDLYAEAKADGCDDLPMATPIWQRIPALHPGSPQGYLQAATVFWDYFEFDQALDEIQQARTRFHDPALYGYEAGAIQEGRRDLPAAIAEYTNVSLAEPVLAPQPNDASSSMATQSSGNEDTGEQQNTGGQSTSEARDRLLHLAHRRDTASAVDHATAAALQAHLHANDPLFLAAISLRADVLLAQRHESDLPPLLDQAIALATTSDQAASIAALAQTKAQSAAMAAVQEHALQRETVLATDPIQKLELQYSLARSYESRKDIADAQHLVDAIHTANPRILGVVRATTGFYDRTAQPARAISTLLEAAKVANRQYAPDFQLEAAQKANAAADYAQARSIDASLLEQSPYDARYIAVMADSYARAGDDAALKQFYLSKLDAVRAAAVPADERKADTALLRRGLIPALTRLKDYQGALDQYIALISAYPEDADTAQQAALFAIKYQRQPYLLAFLNRTVQQSPKDSRFAILLAQTETTFDDLPAAIDAYNHVLTIRKDRSDVYIAKAELEARLGRLDDAATDYERIYTLTYRDPQWMVKLAELRARQQRPTDAVKALEAAWINGRPPQADNSFEAADQLEKWNLLPQARTFAEQGVQQMGADLLTSGNPYYAVYQPSASGAAIYARILTRLGHPEIALATLERARQQADSPSALADAVHTGDPETDKLWRARLAASRRANADTKFRQALGVIGATLKIYATPEQKLAYAQLLDQRHQAGNDPELWASAAGEAGLLDRQAAWLKQSALSNSQKAESSLSQYTSLETTRLQYEDLAATLESAAKGKQPGRTGGLKLQAAEAWRNAGDEAAQIRVYQSLPANEQVIDHFFGLLLRRNPSAFVALAASSNTELADAAANYAVAHGNPAIAQQAIDARAAALTPLWKAATTSLVGLYLTNGRANLQTDAAFHQALADGTIAQQLAHPADPDKQLTGNVWFYYSARYGAYRAATAATDAEDFLPSQLELTPGSPGVYLDLARTYAANGNPTAALTEYDHALELANKNPAIAATVHDQIALLLWRANRKDEAIEHWKQALASLFRVQDESTAPESFWATFALVTHHLGQSGITAQLHPEIESVLRPYLVRNGSYRSIELLRDIFEASATPGEGASWILALAASTGANDQQSQVLFGLTDARWLPLAAREALFVRFIELDASSKNTSASELQTDQLKLIQLYLDHDQLAQAEALFRTIAKPKASPRTAANDSSGTASDSDAEPCTDSDPCSSDPDLDSSSSPSFQSIQIILAARTGKLAALLAVWHTNPNAAPSLNILTQTAKTLTTRKDSANARLLLEFVYEAKQRDHTLTPTDLLALAQARIDTADLPGAMELLHNLTLMPPAQESNSDAGDYINFDSAARLLEASGHPNEALPFLKTLTADVPWSADLRLRLAHAEQAAKSGDANATFTALAKDPTAPYAIRVEAAKSLTNASDLGSAELNLLTNPTITPAQARQPYFTTARLVAAKTSPDQRVSLLRETIAIDPDLQRARLDLVIAEADAKLYAPALAAYTSVVTQSRRYVYDDPSTAEESQDPNEVTDPSPPPATLPAIAANDSAAGQLALAEIVANLYGRNGQTSIELTYLQLAQNLQPTPARHQEMLRLEALIQLAHKNTNRRPVIHEALDQSGLVEPRLTLAQMQQEDTP